MDSVRGCRWRGRRAHALGVLLLVTCLCSLPAAAEAQQRSPRALGGAGLVLSVPQGEFADFVGNGYGFGGHLVYLVDPLGVVGIRLDGSNVTYGSERLRVPWSQTVSRVLVDVTTRNNIAVLSLGPQLTIPLGPVRPYANASAGIGYFYTRSSLRGTHRRDFRDIAATTNFDDLRFGYGLGGGVAVGLRSGRQPVFLALDAQYRRYGSTRYLREGGIVEDGAGGLILDPIRSEADVLLLQLGLSVGI